MLSLAIIAFSSPARGAQPINILQGHFDQVFSILRDPQYGELSPKTLQKERIWNIFEEIFDFTEVSRQTVGKKWQSFSEQQQKEFTRVFAEFLCALYLEKLQQSLTDEKILYISEDLISESKVLVNTMILNIPKGVGTSVGYNMHTCDGAWKVYDVKIEGISLVNIYRSQFKKILLKESPDHLISQLKRKINAKNRSVEQTSLHP